MRNRAIMVLLAGCTWAGLAWAQASTGTHAVPTSSTTTRTSTTVKPAVTPPAPAKAKSAAASSHSAEMMRKCEAMAAEHEGMKARMVGMDESLNRLVVTMNTSAPDRRIDAMAAVLNELVTQRQAMHGMNSKMHDGMSGHMAAHMKSGSMASMSDCPMMKAMGHEKSHPMGVDKADAGQH